MTVNLNIIVTEDDPEEETYQISEPKDNFHITKRECMLKLIRDSTNR